MFHPVAQRGAGGASEGLPAGTFASTHDEIVEISSAVSEISFEKCPQQGSANHGRHSFRAYGLFNLIRPRICLLIGHEREWRDFSWAMADLAMLLEDGQNVFVKRRRSHLVSWIGTSSMDQRDTHCRKNEKAASEGTKHDAFSIPCGCRLRQAAAESFLYHRRDR